jgi:hypothetical protein
MSFIHSHAKITAQRLRPEVIQTNAVVAGIVATYTITPTTPPTPGSLMWISIAGTANRGILTQMSGGPWAYYDRTSAAALVTMGNWFKFATASEPASYSVTFTATVAGGWRFMELSNVDTDYLIGRNGAGALSVTSLAMPSYSSYSPSIMLTSCGKSLTTNWTSDNGTTNLSGAGQHKCSYKQYDLPASSEIITWSGPVQDVIADWFVIRGKPIY